MKIPNFVTVIDSNGDTFVQAVPVEGGSFVYSDLQDGTILIVGRVKNLPIQFALAPAELTADERAFREALEEFSEERRGELDR
jgi:hypothetical protein